MPAFVSIPLVVAPDGSPTDMSEYTGVKLRVKVKSGALAVQVGTAVITNFDYHTSAPLTRNPDAFDGGEDSLRRHEAGLVRADRPRSHDG